MPAFTTQPTPLHFAGTFTANRRSQSIAQSREDVCEAKAAEHTEQTAYLGAPPGVAQKERLEAPTVPARTIKSTGGSEPAVLHMVITDLCTTVTCKDCLGTQVTEGTSCRN